MTPTSLPPVFAAIEARQYGLFEVPAAAFRPVNYIGKSSGYKTDLHYYEEAFYYEAVFPTRYADGYVNDCADPKTFKLRAHNLRVYLRRNEASCNSLYTQPKHRDWVSVEDDSDVCPGDPIYTGGRA